MVGAKTAHFM